MELPAISSTALRRHTSRIPWHVEGDARVDICNAEGKLGFLLLSCAAWLCYHCVRVVLASARTLA